MKAQTDMHHVFTSEQLKEGWRFGIWRNFADDGKSPGGYVKRDGQILRFERAADALAALKRLGYRDHVGTDVQKGKKRSTKPTAYVCQIWPEVKS